MMINHFISGIQADCLVSCLCSWRGIFSPCHSASLPPCSQLQIILISIHILVEFFLRATKNKCTHALHLSFSWLETSCKKVLLLVESMAMIGNCLLAWSSTNHLLITLTAYKLPGEILHQCHLMWTGLLLDVQVINNTVPLHN